MAGKTTIRLGCFETNSSSVHSIVFTGSLDPSKLEKDKDGNLVAHLDYFGRTEQVLTTQQEKFNYVITYFYCKHSQRFFDESLTKKQVNDEFKDFIEEYSWDVGEVVEDILRYTGAKGIVLESDDFTDFGFDHQSSPDSCSCGDNPLDSLSYKDFLTFIFNPNAGLRMESD